MTNGVFAMHARTIFFGDRATWKYTGERIEDGKNFLRVDFAVPSDKSGYFIRSASGSAVVGFHGFFLADPETLDLRRLEIYSDSIPKEIGMERADMAIEYQQVLIGASDALLPRVADVITTLRRNKMMQRNRITFSGCRQYGSESVISFLPEGADGTPGIRLPDTARLVLRLASPLDSAKTLAGTPVEAILDENVTAGERVLVPKGARVRGRIRKLERLASDDPAFEIGMEFTRAEWDGGSAVFTASLEEVESVSGAQLNLRTIADEPTNPPAVGTFFVRGKAFSLYQGFRTVWKVQPPEEPAR
jgi:hypothetical protein